MLLNIPTGYCARLQNSALCILVCSAAIGFCCFVCVCVCEAHTELLWFGVVGLCLVSFYCHFSQQIPRDVEDVFAVVSFINKTIVVIAVNI